MANEIIRPTQLPARADPVASEVVPSDNGATVGGVTWADGVNAAVPVASQAESEAGVINTKRMTPLTTKQAIDAQVPPLISGAISGLGLDTMSQESASDYTKTADLAAVALSNDYGDLDNRPTLGSAAATDAADYATAAQGAKADTAVQPSRTVGTGTGLTGGGDLSANRTISLTPESIASLSRADSSVQTVNGLAPDGSGNVSIDAEFLQEQDSVTTAMAESFAPTVQWVRTAGHAAAGDGGEALYIRSLTEPSHAAKFQDADGGWFEFVGRKIRVQHIQATAGLSGFDATDAIQECLDYLEIRDGGELSIVPGTYDVSDIIRIPSKVKIVGDDGAIINRVANTNSVFINKSDGSLGGYGASRNISISGVTIECNGATYTTPCTPVAFGHARKISIKNVTVRDVPGGWHAIELCAVSGAKIKGVTLDGGGNDLDTGEAIQLDIMGSAFGFPWFGPYDHMWCEDVVIEDVTITNWAVGIGSHSVSSTPGGRHSDVKIRDCRISVSRHGITPYGWTRVSIRDNIITNYMRADTTEGKNSIGINVTSTANNNCTAIRIRDNIIDGFERGGTTENSRGIAVAGPSSGAYTRQVSISGNFISNVKRHGIGVDYAQDVLVFGNRLEGIGQVGIYMFGSTKSSVKDNRVISGGAGYDDIIVNHGALTSGTLLDVIVSGNYCPRKMTANGTRIIVVQNIVGITTGSIDGTIINGTKAGNLVNGAWS